MNTPSRIYDPKQMAQIAEFYSDIKAAIDKLEPEISATMENPLYVFGMEIVIRHRDGYTIGRIGMDDFPYFELTDENYVSEAEEVKRSTTDVLLSHIRQEDTASGQKP